MLFDQYILLGRLQRVIESPQHREGNYDLLKLALLECAIKKICNRPDKTNKGIEVGIIGHGVGLSAGVRRKLAEVDGDL